MSGGELEEGWGKGLEGGPAWLAQETTRADKLTGTDATQVLCHHRLGSSRKVPRVHGGDWNSASQGEVNAGFCAEAFKGPYRKTKWCSLHRGGLAPSYCATSPMPVSFQPVCGQADPSSSTPG